MQPPGILARRHYWAALLMFSGLAAAYIALVFALDNTNLGTNNGLWKSTWIHGWETGAARLVDTGSLLYVPVYGMLCRVIPDRAVSYGLPGKAVTYRKITVLNALFSALASCVLFLMALRLTSSLGAALVLVIAHASAGFVLLHSVTSEDIMPAYTFFVIAAGCFFEHAMTRKLRWLVCCAGFLVLTTVFHWTLMVPAVAAIGAAQLVLVLRREHPAWSLAALPLLVLGMMGAAALLVHFLYPDLPSPLLQVLFPLKAHPDGWAGFTRNKFLYALIGIGNYFSGARQVGDYHALAYPDVLKPMIVSWLYWAFVMAVSVWALFSRRADGRLRLLAGFGLVLFAVGELESLYVFPQDPQWQMQPMFASVTALIVLLNCLHLKLTSRTYRLAAAEIVRRRILEAFAAGRRVVACSLWVKDRAEFVGSMSTLIENERAGAFYDALRDAFRVGRSCDTPVGPFVELFPAGQLSVENPVVGFRRQYAPAAGRLTRRAGPLASCRQQGH